MGYYYIIGVSSNGKQSFLSAFAHEWKNKLFHSFAHSTVGHQVLHHRSTSIFIVVYSTP